MQNTVTYDRISPDGVARREAFPFAYTELPPFPETKSNRDLLAGAIERSETPAVKKVLTDVLRYLFLSSFAPKRSRGLPRERFLDQAYPYCGTIDWAESRSSGRRLSGKTNTLGAVLYLLMESEDGPEVKRILAGVLVSMLGHRRFREDGNPPIPRIETR
jgi:hypothetical protein